MFLIGLSVASAASAQAGSSSPTRATTMEYVLGGLTFNISMAVTTCADYGDGSYILATWSTEDDLAAIIALCRTQNTFCFTQYKVDAGAHVSEIDGSPMPSYFTFWQGSPLFTPNQSVMVRWDLDVLLEHLDAGQAICGRELPIFVDGFESGELSTWSSSGR